jgi:flagellin
MSDMRATTQTGLRVGDSDLRDTLRTTKLNATSATSYLDKGTGNSAGDGYFGLRYSTDFNAETPSTSTWDIYGYVSVDASADSISSLVQEINQGRQATGTMTFNTFTSESVGDTFSVNGYTITFTSGTLGASTFDKDNKTGTIGLGVATTGAGTMNGSSVALAVANFFNHHASTIGVYGANQGSMATSGTFTGTTVHLFSFAFGEAGNSIATAANVDGTATTAGITMGQINLSHGGEKLMTASAYFDPDNLDYELQLQMNHGGEKYQVQTFTPSGFSSAASHDYTTNVVGGTISSAPFDWGYALVNTTTGHGSLSAYGAADSTTEWDQVQNGSGRTEWDGADILTQSAAQLALQALDSAVNKKDTGRASLGALQNRLQNTITNLQIQAENLQAAESRISDVDVATEMTEFTKNNILAQAATAMLAQANSLPQLALKLLG